MRDAIVGNWTLRSFRMEDVETGERSEPFGPAPRGTLMLHGDGRMAVLITPEGPAAGREAGAAAPFDRLVAYAGRYRLEPPDRLVTTVDVAWRPDWIGTDQVRTYVLDGDRLDLVTPPGRMPRPGADAVTVFATLSWRRQGSGSPEEPPTA